MMTDIDALLREREQRIADLRPGSNYRRRAAAWSEAFHVIAATAQGLAVREAGALDGGSGWTDYCTSGATVEQRAIVTVAHAVGMYLLAPADIRADESFACHADDEAELIRLGHGDPFGRQAIGDKAVALLRPRMGQVRELAEQLIREGRIVWPDHGRAERGMHLDPSAARSRRIEVGRRALAHAIGYGAAP